MNFELSMQLAQEKTQRWRDQADLERQVRAANPLRLNLPKLHLPRLSFARRHHA